MIARVFPRRIPATTPDDPMAFVGDPPLPEFIPNGIERVMVSCLFTWDRAEAERLGRAWSWIAPTEVGGPAFNSHAGEFIPGRFVKPGYTITSRGCPNECWFCDVPKREGGLRELPIRDGWNVLDSNLLACSEDHIRAVFGMLAQQKRKPEFTGGLEAKRLQFWHAERLKKIRAAQVFFAFDTPDDLEPLQEAGIMMLRAGFTRVSHDLRCYVLCGFPRDLEDAAEARINAVIEAGFTPFAMPYRDHSGQEPTQAWKRFARKWSRPAISHAKKKEQQ